MVSFYLVINLTIVDRKKESKKKERGRKGRKKEVEKGREREQGELGKGERRRDTSE
jgi:hypothetical protein